VTCWDALGNTAIDISDYYVDKKGPVISSWFGQPWVHDTGVDYVTTTTDVFLDAIDPLPHPSGLDKIEYRVNLVDDSQCWDPVVCADADSLGGDYTLYEGEFKIAEESCHMIEAIATDNVEKEGYYRTCVFVDDTGPEPIKTVGKPSVKWDGASALFYDIADLCWNGEETSIDCWKTTLLTPISMECVDGPEEHPVGTSHVCFMVDLDGDDATENYCTQYNGLYEDGGYCCVDSTLDPFYFGEISEHNLKYYCVDRLFNVGDVDDEKFKVEETTFEIDLNDKWNLISVPVKLLDDSLDIIFADIADKVESVWTYDAVTGEWFAYTPDGDDMNDDFDTMLPGWGYWVLMNDDAHLLIGGSLFSPAQTPPSKEIKGDAWNLVGYYGAEEQDGYYGPAGNGKEAGCAFFSMSDSYWDIGWTGLEGYWEPYNPFMWQGYDRYDHLDPGAGYWIFATEDGVYSPTTNCYGLWGDDN